MSVLLRPITPENFKECIDLKVSDSQKDFVAPNAVSIAWSKVYPTANVFAVYNDDEMVGFVMFGLDTEDELYYLGRLMIDERFQGKGFGKAATLAVIEELKKNGDCKEIYLSFVPENTNAERLYKSVGFERTGELNGDEIVMRYIIKNNANPRSAI